MNKLKNALTRTIFFLVFAQIGLNAAQSTLSEQDSSSLQSSTIAQSIKTPRTLTIAARTEIEQMRKGIPNLSPEALKEPEFHAFIEHIKKLAKTIESDSDKQLLNDFLSKVSIKITQLKTQHEATQTMPPAMPPERDTSQLQTSMPAVSQEAPEDQQIIDVIHHHILPNITQQQLGDPEFIVFIRNLQEKVSSNPDNLSLKDALDQLKKKFAQLTGLPKELATLSFDREDPQFQKFFDKIKQLAEQYPEDQELEKLQSLISNRVKKTEFALESAAKRELKKYEKEFWGTALDTAAISLLNVIGGTAKIAAPTLAEKLKKKLESEKNVLDTQLGAAASTKPAEKPSKQVQDIQEEEGLEKLMKAIILSEAKAEGKAVVASRLGLGAELAQLIGIAFDTPLSDRDIQKIKDAYEERTRLATARKELEVAKAGKVKAAFNKALAAIKAAIKGKTPEIAPIAVGLGVAAVAAVAIPFLPAGLVTTALGISTIVDSFVSAHPYVVGAPLFLAKAGVFGKEAQLAGTAVSLVADPAGTATSLIAEGIEQKTATWLSDDEGEQVIEEEPKQLPQDTVRFLDKLKMRLKYPDMLPSPLQSPIEQEQVAAFERAQAGAPPQAEQEALNASIRAEQEQVAAFERALAGALPQAEQEALNARIRAEQEQVAAFERAQAEEQAEEQARARQQEADERIRAEQKQAAKAAPTPEKQYTPSRTTKKRAVRVRRRRGN